MSRSRCRGWWMRFRKLFSIKAGEKGIKLLTEIDPQAAARVDAG